MSVEEDAERVERRLNDHADRIRALEIKDAAQTEKIDTLCVKLGELSDQIKVFLLLKFAIKEFQEDREFRQISKATMTNYMGCLKEFHTYCLEKEIIEVTDITSNTIKSYLIYCQKERGNNPTTINSKL